MSDSTNCPTVAQAESTVVQAAAVREWNRGHAVVRLRHGTKARDCDRGTKLVGMNSSDHPSVVFPRTADWNMAVVTGEASKGLVDADLDCPEAVLAAKYCLPPTGMRFGRRSNPNA